MEISELVKLSLAVLKDWRVIVSAVVFILFISLANYVVKYRKKTHHIKIRATPKEQAAEAPAAGQDGQGEAAPTAE